MSSESNQALALLIASARKQQQLSREALSGLAGVSVSFVRDAELDPSRCSFGKLNSLCTALGLHWRLSKNGEWLWPAMTNAKITTETAITHAPGAEEAKRRKGLS